MGTLVALGAVWESGVSTGLRYLMLVRSCLVLSREQGKLIPMCSCENPEPCGHCSYPILYLTVLSIGYRFTGPAYKNCLILLNV